MNVIIVSDTHMPRMAKQLPEVLRKELLQADLIIHLGDWQTKQVYEELKSYAPVTGVYGNVDEAFFIENFNEKLVLELETHLIGMTHGHGKGKTTEKRAIAQFENDEVEMILFGHSHIPLHKEYEGKILFNPGSPTDKRKQSHYSFGKLIVNRNHPLQIEHVFFLKK
ncbi:metallophosphoesterase family protein [Bacillus sp. RAR_GA_16]|uniref:metallophosphoesterase family protein n=1 Tax=Bacillus sp. RAR_GA_16 TaxID=2876774 RepID=UPI001CC8F12A|nr:metallophosphoesterase family protein [Bacillus sp. RAR_GA_16]MCA0174133.1 metallophosphatase family protein [Bacillus sp. RAR_GA_16]